MGLIALDPKEIRRFVLKSEKELPTPQQTVFLISPMLFGFRSEVDDALGIGIGEVKNLSSQIVAILKRCLVGWENFNTADGTPVLFVKNSSGGASDESLNRLRPEWRNEIGMEIYLWSELKSADIKN